MRLCRTDEWEKVHWNICKLREEKFGPRHQKTLEARMEYLHLTGKEEEALKLRREIVSEMCSLLGPNHQETIGAKADLANSLMNPEGLKLSLDLTR